MAIPTCNRWSWRYNSCRPYQYVEIYPCFAFILGAEVFGIYSRTVQEPQGLSFQRKGCLSYPISSLAPRITAESYTDLPIAALKARKFHKVPILTGFNTNEGAMFVPKNANTGKEFTDFFQELLPGLRHLDLEKLVEVYPDPTKDPESQYEETRRGLGKQFKRLEQAYGQFAYVAPVRQTVHYTSQGKEDGLWGAPPPVYLYHFAASSSVNGGADHGSHTPWVSYMPERRDKGSVVDEISGSMHAYWTSFITSGDPNAVKGRWGERLKWPAYRSEQARMMVFGEGNDELATGGNEGVAVQVKDDGFAAVESEFWWARTELFEF